MAENDDIRDAHRRQLLKAGALAVPVAAVAAAAWSQPTIVQAIGVPMAAASTEEGTVFFQLEFLDYTLPVPTKWGVWDIETTGTLPKVARVTYLGTKTLKTITLGLSHNARGATVSGNCLFCTFFPKIDSAAVTVNGALTPNVLKHYSDEYETAWWGGPIMLKQGWVLDMPLTYRFPDDWSSEANQYGPGSISVELETVLPNSDGTKSSIESVRAEVVVLKHHFPSGPGLP
jgi:hypothetical protein